MSSLITPPLATLNITDRPVREPASEWASSTLDALGPISRAEDEIASNLPAPGLHVPGAFPSNSKAGDIQQDTEYVKDSAIITTQTTNGYVPTSVEDMKRLMENAGDTVRGYLPGSVAAYLPHHSTADSSLHSEPNPQNVHPDSLSNEGACSVHHTTNTSLPSEETSQNTHPESSNGVGILPGPPGEIGVAIPPDEPISSPTSESTSPPTSHNHGPNSETLRSEKIFPEERRQQNLPSHDDDHPFATEKGKPVSTGGVGVLPGDKKEVGVALLPKERKSPVGTINGAGTDASTRLLRGAPSTSVQDRDISQYTLPATGSASLAPISYSNKNTKDSPPHSSHSITPNTTVRMHPLTSDGVESKGVALSESSQKELGEELLSPTEKSIGGRRNLEQGQVAAAAVGPSSYSVHDSVRKKAGFLDKLKGEVKVISGKLSHKESMVEEGRRMMGKT